MAPQVFVLFFGQLKTISFRKFAEEGRLNEDVIHSILRMGLERDKVFAALWAETRRNGNESADDIALINKLAYWCSADPDAMIRAFLSSPYHAQKEEAHKQKCQRTDYLPNTAKNACDTAYSTASIDYERRERAKTKEIIKAR